MKKFIFSLRIIVLFFLFFLGNIFFFVDASYFQDDEVGIYKVDFLGSSAGMKPLINGVHDTGLGIVKGDMPGDVVLTLSDVEVSSLKSRDTIVLGGSNIAGNVTAVVKDCNGSILGSVVADANNEIDLSFVGNNVYCLQTEYEWNDMSVVIDNVEIRWTPLPVFLLDLVGEATIPAGSCNTYDVYWSLSYVDETNVVLYVELPTVENGKISGFTSAYGQYPDTHGLDLVFASNNGQYTDTPLVIHGVDIPANSVYWSFDSVSLGSSYQYSLTLCSDNLSENNVGYSLDAYIYGSIAESKHDVVTSNIISTPDPVLNPDSPNVAYLGGGTEFISGTSGSYHQRIDDQLQDKTITYVMSLTNLVSSLGVEDIFFPRVYLDFSDLNAGLSVGGCDVGGLQSRVTLASGRSRSGDVVAVYNDSYTNTVWSSVSNVQNNQYQDIFTVDFSGCSDIGDTYDVVLYRNGDNINTLSYTYKIEISPPPPPSPFCGDGIVNQQSEQCDVPDLGTCGVGQLCDASSCLCYTPTPGGGGGGGGSACQGACWYNKCVTTDYDYENDGVGYVTHDNTVCYDGYKAGSVYPFMGPDPITGDHPYNSASFYYNDFVYSLIVQNASFDQNAGEPRRGIYLFDDFQNDIQASAGIDWVLEEVRIEGKRGSDWLTSNMNASKSFYNDRKKWNVIPLLDWKERTDVDDRVKVYFSDKVSPSVPSASDFNALGGVNNIPSSLGSDRVDTMLLSDVKALSVYIPCLNFFGDPAISGTSCDGAPHEVVIKFRVRREDPTNQMCTSPNLNGFSIINDSELYQFYEQAGSSNDDNVQTRSSTLIDDDKGVQINVNNPYAEPNPLPFVDTVYNDVFKTGSKVGVVTSKLILADSMNSSVDEGPDGDIQGFTVDMEGYVTLDMPLQCDSKNTESLYAAYSLDGWDNLSVSLDANDACNVFGDGVGTIDEWKSAGLIPSFASNIACKYIYQRNAGYIVQCTWDANGSVFTKDINKAPTEDHIWFKSDDYATYKDCLNDNNGSFSVCLGDDRKNLAIPEGCMDARCIGGLLRLGSIEFNDFAECSLKAVCDGAEDVFVDGGPYLSTSFLDFSIENIGEFSECVVNAGYLLYPNVSNNDDPRRFTLNISESGLDTIVVDYQGLKNPQNIVPLLDLDGNVRAPVFVPARNEGGELYFSMGYKYSSGACLSDDMQIGVSFDVSSYVRQRDPDCVSYGNGIPPGSTPTPLPHTYPPLPPSPPDPGFVTSNAKLETKKYHDAPLIETNGSIRYLLETKMYAQSEQGLYVFDKIPNGTQFVEAYTSGDFEGGEFIGYTGNVLGYTCEGCVVWFYDQASGGPFDFYNDGIGYDPTNAMTNNPSALGFQQGMEITPGVRDVPFGMDKGSVTWIAFGINSENTPNDIIVNPWVQLYGFKVDNINNVAGDLIYNEIASSSNTLLPSVSNYVVTALIPSHVYDLALRKSITPGYENNTSVGDTISFTIEIFNQGTLPAKDIQITDYFPAELSLVSGLGRVNMGSNKAQYTISDTILPAQSKTIEILFTVNDSIVNTIGNWAEISLDNSTLYGLSDYDSIPDGDNTDCFMLDDYIFGNKSGSAGCVSSSDDEDDHDVAYIESAGIDGVCGSIHNTYWYGINSINANESNLCDVGDVINFVGPDNNGRYTWSCQGINGGSDALCSASESWCGDGRNDSGTSFVNVGLVSEECDDGNDSNNDYCKNDCSLNICGDGVVNTFVEACDDGNMNDNDSCYSANSTNGTPCSFTSCGDNIVQQPNGYGDYEMCDDGSNGDDTDACQDVCLLTTCGDGVVQSPNGDGTGGVNNDGNEQCDDGIDNSDTRPDACRTSCTFPICGDGVVDPSNDEQCDDANDDEFDGCLSNCTLQLCSISGIVYLDIENNDIYEGQDVGQKGQTIQLFLNDVLINSTLTDDEGMYLFDNLDCKNDYEVRLKHNTPYYADSAQLEYLEQQDNAEFIFVPQRVFQDQTLFHAVDNNFGLVSYDLRVIKKVNDVDTELGGAVGILSGSRIQYSITFENSGPTTAYNIVFEDTYNENQIEIIDIDSGGRDVTKDAGSVRIDIPELSAGEGYTIVIDAFVYGLVGDVINNIVSIFTSENVDDMIEGSTAQGFSNNTYTGSVFIKPTCVLDGYFYLDNDRSKEFDKGDEALPGSLFSLDIMSTLGSSVDAYGEPLYPVVGQDGYYRIENLDCDQGYTLVYKMDSQKYVAYSSQHEQYIQNKDVRRIYVPSHAFDTLKTDGNFISERNNFGFVKKDGKTSRVKPLLEGNDNAVCGNNKKEEGEECEVSSDCNEIGSECVECNCVGGETKREGNMLLRFVDIDDPYSCSGGLRGVVTSEDIENTKIIATIVCDNEQYVVSPDIDSGGNYTIDINNLVGPSYIGLCSVALEAVYKNQYIVFNEDIYVDRSCEEGENDSVVYGEIVIPQSSFSLEVPKRFLPTGIPDEFDSLLSLGGYKTFVNDHRIVTSAPYWFKIVNEDEKLLGDVNFRKTIIPTDVRNKYYEHADAIVAIPSVGIVTPVHYPERDGLDDPDDEEAHLQYLDYGIVHRVGTNVLGSKTGPILLEGHSAAREYKNKGPFGAVLKSLVLSNIGDSIYAFIKNESRGYDIVKYRIFDKKILLPEQVDVLKKVSDGTLLISSCGDDTRIGTLKSRNVIFAVRDDQYADSNGNRYFENVPQSISILTYREKLALSTWIQQEIDKGNSFDNVSFDSIRDSLDMKKMTGEKKEKYVAMIDYIERVVGTQFYRRK